MEFAFLLCAGLFGLSWFARLSTELLLEGLFGFLLFALWSRWAFDIECLREFPRPLDEPPLPLPPDINASSFERTTNFLMGDSVFQTRGIQRTVE